METIGQPTNLFDETGQYPSDDALDYIEKFNCLNSNPMGLIEFIERIWWAPDWGFRLTDKTLELHTGGHYYFKLKHEPSEPVEPVFCLDEGDGKPRCKVQCPFCENLC